MIHTNTLLFTKEELGVGEEHYSSEMDFLGIVRNGGSFHPEFMYSARLSITKDDLTGFWEKAEDKGEHSNIKFVKVNELEDWMSNGTYKNGSRKGEPIRFVPSGEATLLKTAEFYRSEFQ